MFYTAWKMRLSAADSGYIPGLASRGRNPEAPMRAVPLYSIRDKILPPKSGYATGEQSVSGYYS